MSIPFHKIEGTGNDFIFLNEEDFETENFDKSDVAKNLCHRHFGVGADGIAFTRDWKEEEDIFTFKWDFYNSDGSPAEMCGNAARCAVVYNFILNASAECEFQTAIGTIYGTFEDDEPVVQWDLKNNDIKELSVSAQGQNFDGFFLNTGVPHFVIPTPQLDEMNARLCAEIQKDPVFGASQTNVTPLQIGNPSLTQSFERGVRDFTLSCGTGVIAAAKVIEKTKGDSQSQLKTPGGELEVKLKNSNVSLKGPAFCVFKGIIDS